jgi:ankyrin repeat protein
MKKYFHASSSLPILDAAQRGDAETVAVLLAADPELITTGDDRGYTVAHWAAYSDDLDVLNVAIAANEQVVWEVRTAKGQTCLHMASMCGSLRVVWRMLELSKDLVNKDSLNGINKVNNDQETALHLAAAANQAAIVELLLGEGVDASLRDRWGRTAAEVRICDCATVLLCYCATVLLCYCATVLLWYCATVLLSPTMINLTRAPASLFSSKSYLQVAMENGYAKTARMIADATGEDVASGRCVQEGQEGDAVHMTELRQRHALLTSELTTNLKLGADSDCLPDTSAFLAGFVSVEPVVQTIFRTETGGRGEGPPGSDCDSSIAHVPLTPLPVPERSTSILTTKALSKLVEYPGDSEELRKLLEDPCVCLNGKDMYGTTALMKFAAWNKTDLVSMLLPVLSAEEVNTTGGRERLPCLHYCVNMDATHTMRVLLREGRIDVSACDGSGRTYVEYAHACGKQGLLDALDSDS